MISVAVSGSSSARAQSCNEFTARMAERVTSWMRSGGITDWSEADRESGAYPEFRERMTSEVSAAHHFR